MPRICRLTRMWSTHAKKTNVFRAPLSIQRKFKQGFRAAYGDKLQVESVDKNTVKGKDGETYSLKQIKPVAA